MPKFLNALTTWPIVYPSKVAESSTIADVFATKDDDATLVVSWYNLITEPFSVLKCGAAFPAVMSDDQNWKLSAVDVVGDVPLPIVITLSAVVPKVPPKIAKPLTCANTLSGFNIIVPVRLI